MKCPLKKGFRIQFDIGCFPGEKRAGAGKLRRELPAGSPGRRGEVSDGQRPGLRSWTQSDGCWPITGIQIKFSTLTHPIWISIFWCSSQSCYSICYCYYHSLVNPLLHWYTLFNGPPVVLNSSRFTWNKALSVIEIHWNALLNLYLCLYIFIYVLRSQPVLEPSTSPQIFFFHSSPVYLPINPSVP